MSIEKKERGPEVAVQCAWLITGIAVAYWIDFGFVLLENQASWVSTSKVDDIRSNALTQFAEIPHCFPICFRYHLFGGYDVPP